MLHKEKYIKAIVEGVEFEVVNPSLFYSKEVNGMGLGLFCETTLHAGDIWWAHNMHDKRFVEVVYTWDEYLELQCNHKRRVETRCYVEPESRRVIVCAEPFCRVNHGNIDSLNSDSDNYKNSVASKLIPAGNQILISYDYEAIISLVWKFDDFRLSLPKHLLNDDSFLFMHAEDSAYAINFLHSL